MQTQITCPSCGANNPAGKVLCTSCGKALMQSSDVRPQQMALSQPPALLNFVPPEAAQPIETLPSMQIYWARFLERPEYWFATALIVAFFLPWVSIMGFISISGMQIPDIGRGIQQMTFAFSQNSTVTPGIMLLNLVYLVPILAIATLVIGLSGKDIRIVSIATGILPILIFILILINLGGMLFQVMGLGAYVTLLASVGMILTERGVIKAPRRSNRPTP